MECLVLHRIKKEISNEKQDQLAIYQSQSGAIQLKTNVTQDSLWANLLQIAQLFNTDKSGISRHIKNIYKTKELSRKATVAKFATVQKEGATEVVRNIEYFNLDVILSVGYRVNSKKATHFRQWATKTLKNHILKGYTINHQRIQKNYTDFLQAVEDVKNLLPPGTIVDNDSVLKLVKLFADTWFSLDAFDKDQLEITDTTKKKIKLISKN